jgi:replicative DNA helicase
MSNVVPFRRQAPDPDGQEPPNDLFAELAVITTAMLEPKCAAEALAVSPPTDFYSGSHRAIAECIADLVDRGEPWDMTSVGIRLHETGKIKVVGGAGQLLEMVNQVPAITTPRKYAERVRDTARLRRLAEAARLVCAECYEPQPDIPAFLAKADSIIGEVTRTAGRGRAVGAMTGLRAMVTRLGEPMSDRIHTGLRTLDDWTTGFERGCMYVLGARLGMGKTALAMQLVIAAAKAEKRVLVVSLEMSQAEIWDRLASAESGVPMQAIRKRQISPLQWSHLTHACSRLAGLGIVVADAPAQTLLDVRAMARQERAELVVVDHIGLMKAVANSQAAKRSREQEVAEFSRGLKGIAKELQIPVMVLAQVNRESSKAAAPPRVDQLADSDAVGRDADSVWLLHRPGYYDIHASDDRKREAQLIVAKQRQGPTGPIHLVWRAEHMQFAELEA